MPFGALLQSETTIKHFTWCSRAENFVECTKRQGYQPTSVAWSVLFKRFRPVASVEDELKLKASVIYLLSIQFKYISRRGLKTLQAMLILHSSLNPAQIDRKRECLTRNRILARWLCGQIRYLYCVVIHFCTKHLIGLSFDTERFKF